MSRKPASVGQLRGASHLERTAFAVRRNAKAFRSALSTWRVNVGWAVPNAIDLSVSPKTAMGQVVSTCPHMPEKPCLSRMQTQRAVRSRRPHRSRCFRTSLGMVGTAHPTRLPNRHLR